MSTAETSPVGREPELEINVDLTSVGVESGGIGTVACELIPELAAHNVFARCLVGQGASERWSEKLGHNLEVSEIRVVLRADSRWQNALRKVLPPALKTHPIVGAVRNRRSRAVAAAAPATPVWYPFHRSPAAADLSVVTVHDLRVFEPALASTMDQAIIRKNVANAKAVVCSWPHPYEHLLELFPEAADKAFLVGLPVLNTGTPVLREVDPDGAVRLLCPGFVTPHKNQELLIRALVDLPMAVATFTGSETASYASFLKELAITLGVDDRVSWRGYVGREELNAEFDRAHILVMPTRWEAASGPLFEAIARHLPFVASEIPPIRVQVDNLGIDALLFDPDSPSALVDAIRACIATYADQRTALVTPAAAVRSRTWSDTAGEYARIFRWVAGDAEYPSDLGGPRS
ncbi:MAG: glycosyltransferase [Kineosporiaceae bacterium]|nr:glycosyltransferase [Aeromicrobium sp.]